MSCRSADVFRVCLARVASVGHSLNKPQQRGLLLAGMLVQNGYGLYLDPEWLSRTVSSFRRRGPVGTRRLLFGTTRAEPCVVPRARPCSIVTAASVALVEKRELLVVDSLVLVLHVRRKLAAVHELIVRLHRVMSRLRRAGLHVGENARTRMS